MRKKTWLTKIGTKANEEEQKEQKRRTTTKICFRGKKRVKKRPRTHPANNFNVFFSPALYAFIFLFLAPLLGAKLLILTHTSSRRRIHHSTDAAEELSAGPSFHAFSRAKPRIADNRVTLQLWRTDDKLATPMPCTMQRKRTGTIENR